MCESNKNDVISISYCVIAFLGPRNVSINTRRSFPREWVGGGGAGHETNGNWLFHAGMKHWQRRLFVLVVS